MNTTCQPALLPPFFAAHGRPNTMDRRRLQQSALLWALSACLPLAVRSQTGSDTSTEDLPSPSPTPSTNADTGPTDVAPPKPPAAQRPEDPSVEQASLGLRSMLEVAVHDALEPPPETETLRWTPRLRAAWDHGDWLTDPARRLASPWLRFEHFEAVAQESLSRCWPQAYTNLMLLVHHMHDGDLRAILIDTVRRPDDGHWATVQLDRRVSGRVHSRLLGEVVQVQLEWLKAHQDRYPNLPTPRNAQVEMEHFECCQRITRAIVDTVFLAIARQEQRWRQMPLPDINVPSQMATLIALLGPPTGMLPFAVHVRLQPAPLIADAALLVPESLPTPTKRTKPSKSRKRR